jgi:hypothetical protein
MKKLKTGVTTTEENGRINVTSPYFKEVNYYDSEERKVSERESSIIVVICLAIILLSFVALFVDKLIGWL